MRLSIHFYLILFLFCRFVNVSLHSCSLHSLSRRFENIWSLQSIWVYYILCMYYNCKYFYISITYQVSHIVMNVKCWVLTLEYKRIHSEFWHWIIKRIHSESWHWIIRREFIQRPDIIYEKRIHSECWHWIVKRESHPTKFLKQLQTLVTKIRLHILLFIIFKVF